MTANRPSPAVDKKPPVVCSFCMKSEKEVAYMIVEATGAACICDECVEVCVQVVFEGNRQRWAELEKSKEIP